MKLIFQQIKDSVDKELESFSMECCHIPAEKSQGIIVFLQKMMNELRDKLLSHRFENEQDEIHFFKELKPQLLSKLLFFNKVHTIELRKPNGSDMIQLSYYEREQESLNFFFNRHLDFYQYYRSNSTHLDEQYFVRGKTDLRLCLDSVQFITDRQFSTGYDYKVAKILSNEMLRIYLNQKMRQIDRDAIKQEDMANRHADRLLHKWTGDKIYLIEMGYALFAAGQLDNGNAKLNEIMDDLSDIFNIDLGDYHRSFIAMKGRKKERTKFLKLLIEALEKYMDREFE